tara:strand:+ start:184 stop:804 length:621 start_codon:yes stop_codon:yes gene_type:complete
MIFYKNITGGFMIIFLLVLCLGYADSYKVDVDSSTIQWIGRKVTGEHDGNLKILYGNIRKYLDTEQKEVIKGNIVIDMTTITNNDIESKKYQKYFVDHLNSSDFFDVAHFSKSQLKILDNIILSNDSSGNMMITAEITIKGITQKVKFPAKIEFLDDSATAVGTIDIDRTLFDIRYKSKSFFPDVGDYFIYDDFTLNFTIKAKKSN